MTPNARFLLVSLGIPFSQQSCLQQYRLEMASVKRAMPTSRKKIPKPPRAEKKTRRTGAQDAALKIEPGRAAASPGRTLTKASRSDGNAAISPRQNREFRSKTQKKQGYSRKWPWAVSAPGPAETVRWPPCPDASGTSRRHPSLAATGMACIDRSWPLAIAKKQASRRNPFRNRPFSPRLHAPTANSREEWRKVRSPSPAKRRPQRRVRRRRRVRRSRLPGRKAGNAAALPRPDRYAAQISSTIDSEARATSATSVRPPSNTATSTANRRRSPTSR